jgi:hypothetical protein
MILQLTRSIATVFLIACCAMAQAQQTPDEAAEQLAPETNPAVLAALELPRTKPSHYVGTILSLVDLGRPELAQPILEELQAQNLSDVQRAELVREFGTQRMMRLARTPGLAPAGRQFAEACLAAAATEARNPERLQQLIDKLADPSPEVRHAARVDLASAGMPGTMAAVEAFGRETDPARRAALAAAIVRMGPASVGPLLGMLSTGDAMLQAEVIQLLEAMHVAQAMPLVAAARSSDEAEQLLSDAIGRYQRGMRAFATDEDGQVALWHWNDATKKLGSTRHPIDAAQTIWMARLAAALAELRPENRAYQHQAIVLGLEGDLLEWLRTPVARSEPPALQALHETADVATLSTSLADAMGQNYALAAAALTELLGQRVDKTALIAADGRPAPLVAALDYPDRRVRFAALEAILQIAPDSPFPGSSHVPETLGYFARGTGQRRAVVAMPTIQRAATVAGLLQTAGFDAAVTNRGSDAVKLAQLSPDVEFVLVDMNIQLPGIRDVLYALRIDPATGHLPVGLLAGEGRLAAAQRLADEHDRVLAFARPHSEEKVVAMSERLVALAGHNSVSPDARAAQSKQAIVWLGQLLADGPKFYDLRRQTDVIEAAALRPQAASESIAALAVLGTPAGQRALADLASLQTTSIATRREAAQAFDRNAQQHGLLLTSDEILRQYDRYNASATADAESQQVLGTVLDAIESQRSRQQTLPHAP